MSYKNLKLQSFLDGIKNTIYPYDLAYICEKEDWSIKNDGLYLTKNLQNFLSCRTTVNSWGIKNKLIHFGSVNTLIKNNGLKYLDPSNKAFLTWFHLTPDDERIRYIPVLNNKIEYIHTSCETTKKQLEAYGIQPSKIIIIPLGVDTLHFKPAFEKEKNIKKKELNLPFNKKIIGSFQKDGVGWGEGLIPKKIKGPDIFCDVLEELAKHQPIHVLLTGPARGYVKKRLESLEISYTHVYLKNYLDIVNYYQMLDLYLITSRVEGGPKALLEAMACGIPIVSTKVGLVPDIIKKDEVFVSEIDDTKDLIEKSEYLLKNQKKANEMKQICLQTIKAFDWSTIARMYYENLYKSYVE